MPESATATVGQLDDGLILTPERYDPRRRVIATDGPTIRDYADVASEQVSAKTADQSARYLVLDTGDAREGVILTKREPVAASAIGSMKKRIQPGDVIISRLRPYLRQVAYVDPGLVGEDSEIEILCSTEFYVLRRRSDESIAFLAAWLLSPPVQLVLAAAQEGGHHPRFNLVTLEAIAVPATLAAESGSVSATVERAVRQAREAEIAMEEIVRHCASEYCGQPEEST